MSGQHLRSLVYLKEVPRTTLIGCVIGITNTKLNVFINESLLVIILFNIILCIYFFFFFFSHTGKYLCSQGGIPDNSLTVWDWRKSKIVLKTRAHTKEVKMCSFSNYKTHHIVTSSLKFIKFWKISKTFTGLKLKGKLGRFGKLESSEIIGIFSMPDERVRF